MDSLVPTAQCSVLLVRLLIEEDPLPICPNGYVESAFSVFYPKRACGESGFNVAEGQLWQGEDGTITMLTSSQEPDKHFRVTSEVLQRHGRESLDDSQKIVICARLHQGLILCP